MQKSRIWKAFGSGVVSASLVMVATPAVAAAADGTAAVIDHPSFADAGSLELNGTSTLVRSSFAKQRVLRLTSAGYRQAGSAWSPDAVDVTGSFESAFTVHLHRGKAGADGVAFVLQTAGPRALGGWGGGLGYRGIGRSVAVEFDDYQNATESNGNHVAVVVNGNPDFHLTAAEAPIPLFGAPFQARVRYDAAARNLKVYLSSAGGGEERLVIDQAIDLGEHLGSGTAWAGFTGATGFVGSKQDIVSWSLGTPGE